MKSDSPVDIWKIIPEPGECQQQTGNYFQTMLWASNALLRTELGRGQIRKRGKSMGDRGVFGLDRDVLEHPLFKRGPYSEAEAWIYLIQEASWRSQQRRVGEFFVSLERGQVAASQRHLAETWKWTRGKVERFLRKIQINDMITQNSEPGINVITVCNYEVYQRVGLPPKPAPSHDRASTEPRPSHDRANIKETKHGNIETGKEDSSAFAEDREVPNALELFPEEVGTSIVPAAAKPKKLRARIDYSPEFESWWGVYPRPADKVDAFRSYERVLAEGRATHADLLDGARRYAAEKRGDRPKFIKLPATWLNKGSWENAPERRRFSSAVEGALSMPDTEGDYDDQ